MCTYRVGQKPGPLCLTACNFKVTSNLAPIKVILFLTLNRNLFESTWKINWRHLANDNNRNKWRMAIVCSFITSNNRTKHTHKQNRYTKSTFYMSVEHEFNVSAGCRTIRSHSRRRCHSPTLLSMNDCGSFCHAPTIVRFSSSNETKLWRR